MTNAQTNSRMASYRKCVFVNYHEAYEESIGMGTDAILLWILDNTIRANAMEVYSASYWRIPIALGSHYVQIQYLSNGWSSCDGMTTYVPFATKYGQNFEEGIGSISYVTMTCPNTKTNTYFILPISEGLILVYMHLIAVRCIFVFHSAIQTNAIFLLFRAR